MTTVNCDICKSVIPNGTRAIAHLPKIRFYLDEAHDKPCLLGEPAETDIGFLCQFSTTDFACCQSCVIKAFQRAVAELQS